MPLTAYNQSYLRVAMLVLALLTTAAKPVSAFDEPTQVVRDAMTATIEDEDVLVMQAEMAWGAHEMKRYKTLRGDWPLRSKLTADAQSDEEEEEHLFRGSGTHSPNNDAPNPQNDYWNYLVSMF